MINDMNNTVGHPASCGIPSLQVLEWITLKFVPDARKLLQEREVLPSTKLLPTPVVDAIDCQRKSKIL